LCELISHDHYLDAAVKAACAPDEMLRHNFEKPMQVNQSTKHDIKLEIRRPRQELIAQSLLKEFPQHALYGEEGIVAIKRANFNGWSIRSMGTVELLLRHSAFLRLIALRCQGRDSSVGVIFDPHPQRTLDRAKGSDSEIKRPPNSVSERADLAEAIVSVGLSNGDHDRSRDSVATNEWSIAHANAASLQRRARHGLCRVRPIRTPTANRVLVSGMSRRWILVERAGRFSGNETRRDMPIAQHHRVQRRGRFEICEPFAAALV